MRYFKMCGECITHEAAENVAAGKFGTGTALTAAKSNEDKCQRFFLSTEQALLDDYLSSMIQCLSLFL